VRSISESQIPVYGVAWAVRSCSRTLLSWFRPPQRLRQGSGIEEGGEAICGNRMAWSTFQVPYTQHTDIVALNLEEVMRDRGAPRSGSAKGLA